MILDVETPILGDITVDGHLDFDDSKPSVHL